MTKTNRGQATLESLAGLALLGTFVPALLAISYFAFAHLWIEYQIERAALCATTVRSRFCQRELNRNVATFLPWGQWRSEAETQGPTVVVVKAEWVWGKNRWSWKKKLDLELAARADFSR